MAVSEGGALRREFCMVEIGIWQNIGCKEVLRLIGDDKTRFNCTRLRAFIFHMPLPYRRSFSNIQNYITLTFDLLFKINDKLW